MNITRTVALICSVWLAIGSTCVSPRRSYGADLLRPVETISLPGVEGRIDHMAIDFARKRLFVAALGNNSVEIVDLAEGKTSHSVTGLATPQGVCFAADLNRLAVANDNDGSLRLYDGTTLRQLITTSLGDDADNVRYDHSAHRMWVGYGKGGLAEVDPENGKVNADIKLSGHPESFQLESKGQRIFVNVPAAGHVAVVDREMGAVVATWHLSQAAANFPMALEEPHHRLFIGCRKPPQLLVLDTQTGQVIKSLPIAGDADDVFYDAAKQRIYVSGGEGFVTVIGRSNGDTYSVLGNVSTAAGARTSYFDPKSGLLYVAAPLRGGQRAELIVFKSN
jgi:DNA-binding beta-propeller fold protein YncE